MITIEQALEAIDNLDDYARMDAGVDAVGPRELLVSFVIQHEQLRAENEQLAAALAACDAKDARFKQIVRMANHLDVLSIAMQAHDALATKPDASALKAHDEALIESCVAFCCGAWNTGTLGYEQVLAEFKKHYATRT